MTDLERFHACMDYRPADHRPNHELGAWQQTRERWRAEAPGAVADLTRDWFVGEPALGLDHREYAAVNYSMIPPFEQVILDETDRYIVRRNGRGIVTRALKEGTVGGQRMSMDEYIDFPVKTPEDWPDIKRRLVAGIPGRYPDDLDRQIGRWKRRDFPLCLGRNCAARGFYWRAREWFGTENLAYAWYDYPDLLHEMMEFFADFVIETSRPVVERIDFDYFVLNEDMSMKTGPLMSPALYRTFILPHLKRLCAFFRDHGVRHIALDTDGDPTVLLPLFLEGGVDVIWPVERASETDPLAWRREFGRDLRIWGGVDKRILPRGRDAIREHLAAMIPLIEEGGFIPTVDHTVPPDVSWDDFRTYMELKRALLAGEFEKLR
jgi:uroporphyrinogen decarboxylase